jgi:hypothetical protein
VGPVETLAPLGEPFAGDIEADRLMAGLPGLLPGLEWGEMVTLIAGLDPVPARPRGRS